MAKCTTTLRVRYAEVDRLGAVNSSRYFEWFELGREAGLPYATMEERGIMLPVREAHCRYMIKLGYDELVRLETTAEVRSPARLLCSYRLFRTGTAGDELAAEGFTEHAVVGRSGRPTRLPEDVLAVLGGGGRQP
jgi:acyl-CoA thioester hydrolase